jgi:Na+/H+ antiporter NhaC
MTFYGGLAGAFAPFVVFLSGVAWLGLSGAPDERGFWPVLVAALALGLLLARDRAKFCETLLAAMSQPIVMLMIMAWLLAGILGALMGASGFIQALVWLTQVIGLTGGWFASAAFVVCAVVATSTGTSLGTLLLCAPLLYPVGAAVAAAPAVLMGAILGGATFGDSISPISDTTIASSGTQGADIGGVVRSRLKYVLPAGLAAVLITAFIGGAGAAVDQAAMPRPDLTALPRALPMVLVPALVVTMLLKKRHLIEGLLTGAMAATAIGLVLGLLSPRDLLRVEPGSFTAKGLIIEGIDRAVGVSIFTILLVGLVSTLTATDALARLVALARRHARSVRDAEIWIVGSVSAAVLVTTHSVVAILTVGDFARETGTAFGLSAYRRANLLDVAVCTYPFLLPYFIPTVIAASTSATGAALGMPRLSPLVVGLHNTYSWGLMVMLIVAVITGYGRGEGPVQGR